MEWQVSNNFNAYPFVEPSGPIGSEGRPLSEAIADASLYVSSEAKTVYLEYLSDPTQAPVSVRFSDGSAEIAAFEDGQLEEYGAWTICRWGKSFLLVETAKVSNFSWPVETNMELVPHVINRGITGVTKFIADLGGGLRFEMPDILELEEGANLGITVSDSSRLRQASRVRLSVGVNAGQTTMVLCDAGNELFRVNGVDPIDGKISISGADCTFASPVRGEEVSPGVWSLHTGQLKLYDFCRPCCDCDDYVQTYTNLLYPFSVTLEQLANRINELAQRYEEARESINQVIRDMSGGDDDDDDDDDCEDIAPCLQLFVDIQTQSWYLNMTVTIVNGCAFPLLDGELSVIQEGGPKLTIIQEKGPMYRLLPDEEEADLFGNLGKPIEEPEDIDDHPLFGSADDDDCDDGLRELQQTLEIKFDGKRVDIGPPEDENDQESDRKLPPLLSGEVQQITIPMYMTQTQPLDPEDRGLDDDDPVVQKEKRTYGEAYRHFPETDVEEGHRATPGIKVRFNVLYEAKIRVTAAPPQWAPDSVVSEGDDDPQAFLKAAIFEYFKRFYLQFRRNPTSADVLPPRLFEEGEAPEGGEALRGMYGLDYVNRLLPAADRIPDEDAGSIVGTITGISLPDEPTDAEHAFEPDAFPNLDENGLEMEDPVEDDIAHEAVDADTVTAVYNIFWRETVLRGGATPSNRALAYHFLVSDAQHQQIASGSMAPPTDGQLDEAREMVDKVLSHPYFMTNEADIKQEVTVEKTINRPENR